MIEHLYISRATTLFTSAEFGTLLRTARRNNERLGVTGMLIYREPFFMQVLEGSEQNIASLLERIKVDPRHTDVTQVLHQPLRRRAFGDWSMGFYQAEAVRIPEIVRQYPGYRDFFAADFEPRLFAASPSSTKKLLLAFRQECLRPQFHAPKAEAR